MWMFGVVLFIKKNAEVHSGIDTITVSWKLNATLAPGVDAAYKKVRTKLCFASKSQVLRGWRKTDDNLSKDKTCPYDISLAAYTATGGSANYTIPKATPGASYFVRAFAVDATGTKVAFGQTSDKNRTANTFTVIPVTGRHASIDIAVAIMSAFSVVALFTFYFVEKYYLARKKEV